MFGFGPQACRLRKLDWVAAYEEAKAKRLVMYHSLDNRPGSNPKPTVTRSLPPRPFDFCFDASSTLIGKKMLKENHVFPGIELTQWRPDD